MCGLGIGFGCSLKVGAGSWAMLVGKPKARAAFLRTPKGVRRVGLRQAKSEAKAGDWRKSR